MLIRTHIDQLGHAWVKITDGKKILNMQSYTQRQVNSTIPLAQGTIGEIGADAIRMMFKKMDKDIAIVEKLVRGYAVVVPHAKFCSRTHPLKDNGCDRSLDPLVIAARHNKIRLG